MWIGSLRVGAGAWPGVVALRGMAPGWGRNTIARRGSTATCEWLLGGSWDRPGSLRGGPVIGCTNYAPGTRASQTATTGAPRATSAAETCLLLVLGPHVLRALPLCDRDQFVFGECFDPHGPSGSVYRGGGRGLEPDHLPVQPVRPDPRRLRTVPRLLHPDDQLPILEEF